MNTLNPALMAADDRRAEAAQLLALAVVRLRQRRIAENQRKSTVSSLDCGGASSLHAAGIDA
jgi:hypothetical protein